MKNKNFINCMIEIDKLNNKYNKTLLKNLKNFLNYNIYFPEICSYNKNFILLKYKENNKNINIYFYEKMLKIEFKKKVINIDYNNFYKALTYLKLFFNKNDNAVLFSGSFNPPTIAHSNLIKNILKEKTIDCVIIQIANDNFLSKKQEKNNDWFFNEKERLRMLLEMTYKNPKVLLYGIENNYTYNNLKNIKQDFNLKKLFFACGSDKINELKFWGHSDELLKEFYFYIFIRGNDNYDTVLNKCNNTFIKNNFIINIIDNKYKDLSATKVRNCIKNKENIKDKVDKNVYNYLRGKINGN